MLPLLKLTHIVPSLEAQHGGPSRSVLALSSAHARAGHDVELFATGPGPGEDHNVGALRIRNFHRNWPQRFCPSSGLRDAVRTRESDVIHHHALWLRTLHYAHRAAIEHRAKFIISPRGMMSAWAWNHRGGRKRLASRFIHPGALQGADGWHATSDDEADEIRALGFNEPICVAANGVERPEPAEIAQAVAYWHRACPETAKRPIALFYSRFHRKKRVLEVIDLWLQHGPKDWLLLLVGIPQDYTPEGLDDYVLRASGTGHVRAFSGAGVPAPYPIASLFLLPSHSENFGLVIAESMAHGVPALVTDTTPWRELSRLDLGWCVPWEQFGDTLVQATGEGEQRLRTRGALARDWVLENFSWDKSAKLLANFYATLKARNTR